MTTHTASDIAKWFLRRNELEMKLRDAEFISHLKLQKLLYYAQGVYCAFYPDRNLFDDPIVAWAHGPVVENVYQQYRPFESRGIDRYEPVHEVYTSEEEEALEMVYNHFGQYSAWMLRNMTHNERPWKETKINDVIPVDLMRDFFREEYVDDGEEA